VNDDPTEEEERPTRACAIMVGTVLSKVAEQHRVDSLTPAQRYCLAARLYEECSKSLLKAVEGAQVGSWAHSHHERHIHAAVVEAAKRFESEACEGVVQSIAAKRLREAVRQQWSREPWGSHDRRRLGQAVSHR
jgi:hypothetical protein